MQELKDYPLTPFREALTSLVGALFAAIGVSMAAAGLLVYVGSWRGYYALDWFALCMAWVGHWMMSGVAMWGILFLMVHVVCVHRLIRGTADPFVLLGILFCNQTVVSTLVVCMFARDWEERVPVLVAGAIALACGAAYAWRIYRYGKLW